MINKEMEYNIEKENTQNTNADDEDDLHKTRMKTQTRC